MLGKERAAYENTVLVLVPCKAIHTVGMSYAIDVAFVDRWGTVIRSERAVGPGVRLMTSKGSVMVFERPAAPERVWYKNGEKLDTNLARRQ